MTKAHHIVHASATPSQLVRPVGCHFARVFGHFAPLFLCSQLSHMFAVSDCCPSASLGRLHIHSQSSEHVRVHELPLTSVVVRRVLQQLLLRMNYFV